MKVPFIALCLLMATPLIAHEEDHRNILTVVGQGKAKVMASISDVQLGVEVQGKTAQDVQQALARQIEPVINLLKKEKVDKLQTGTFSISPQYSNDSASYIVGYSGYNTISFSTSIERAGTLVDAAIQAGANRLQNLSQRPDDAALSLAQQEAIKLAINNANTQAKTALEAMQLKQRQVIRVSVGQLGGYTPVYQHAYRSADVMAFSAKSSQILPQEQDIQASVTVEISFE